MPNLVARRPMGEVRPGAAFPPELEALVVDATAVLAEDRIATAAEFQRRLAAILAAHADEATPHLFDGCYELRWSGTEPRPRSTAPITATPGTMWR
ncbi:MAG: hypothetical protein JNL82_40235 [Myxococcales bacterium]|nr:hypothetical protein [Myxococcales bacterium]